MLNIARAPQAGRNFEGFGADPYLMAEAATASVKGIQAGGVMAMAKHYTLNDQERSREWSSSIVDDRTWREIYLPGFEAAVKAGVGSAMCALNGQHLFQALQPVWAGKS
jgi:beta-glucosidase